MTDVPPSGEERRQLRRFGITEPSAEVALHVDLLDAVRRLRGAPDGTLNVALMWVWHAELGRQGERHARAKSTYERLLGRAVVRYRADGEKSAAVAEQRALADDEDVYDALLEYRIAERLEIVAREALRILHASNDNWRTRQANERKGDEFTARTST